MKHMNNHLKLFWTLLPCYLPLLALGQRSYPEYDVPLQGISKIISSPTTWIVPLGAVDCHTSSILQIDKKSGIFTRFVPVPSSVLAILNIDVLPSGKLICGGTPDVTEDVPIPPIAFEMDTSGRAVWINVPANHPHGVQGAYGKIIQGPDKQIYGSTFYYLVKMDTAGNILWSKRIAGLIDITLFSGKIIGAGDQNLMVLDTSGNIISSYPINHAFLENIDTTPSGSLYASTYNTIYRLSNNFSVIDSFQGYNPGGSLTIMCMDD